MPLPDNLLLATYESPCGQLLLGATGDGLCLCDWMAKASHLSLSPTLSPLSSPILDEARRQLDQYFARRRQVFSVPLLFFGTPFQQRVWQSLLQIPYGATMSYGRQAALLGMPQASRAVANANGRNRISIFVPCHRVVGSDGRLTGYSGGLAAKRYLLRLESQLSEGGGRTD